VNRTAVSLGVIAALGLAVAVGAQPPPPGQQPFNYVSTSTGSVESFHVICTGPCDATDIQVNPDTTLAAGFYQVLMIDETADTGNGAISAPVAHCFQGTQFGPGGTFGGPVHFKNGLVVAITTNRSCGIENPSAHAWIGADARPSQ
jgi:hypothetical protein